MGPAIWEEYARLVLHPVLVGTVFLVGHRLIRAAVGRWFYLE
jgi:hypothetical protein